VGGHLIYVLKYSVRIFTGFGYPAEFLRDFTQSLKAETSIVTNVSYPYTITIIASSTATG
jgi:hypothetical protein